MAPLDRGYCESSGGGGGGIVAAHCSSLLRRWRSVAFSAFGLGCTLFQLESTPASSLLREWALLKRSGCMPVVVRMRAAYLSRAARMWLCVLMCVLFCFLLFTSDLMRAGWFSMPAALRKACVLM